MVQNKVGDEKVDIKVAVRNALAFVKDLSEGPVLELKAAALAEVTLSDAEQYWLVTIGFRSFSPHVNVTGGSGLLGQTPHVERHPRDYKQVRVSTATGKVEPRLMNREL